MARAIAVAARYRRRVESGELTNERGFDAPPISEAVLGYEFEPVPGLDVWHIVKLHQLWRDRYPRHSVQQLLPPSGPPPLVFDPMTAQRYWFESASDGLLIQVQADRLILNWRKDASDSAYPGFLFLRAEFISIWAEFTRYLKENSLDSPEMKFVEFTYVNQFPAGESLPRMLSVLHDAPPVLPGDAGALALQMRRALHGDQAERAKGELLINAINDIDQLPSSLVLITRLVAGDPGIATTKLLDQAHGVGKEAFLALTTDDAQNTWGRT